MLQTFFTVCLLLAPSLAGPLEEVRCQQVSSCIASSVKFIIRCETILYEYERIRISFKNIGNQLPVWWPKNYMNLNFTETRRLTQWWVSTKGGRREIILKQGKTLSNIQWNQLKDFQSGFKLSKVNFELETVCVEMKTMFENVDKMWFVADGCQRTLLTSMYTMAANTETPFGSSSSSFPAKILKQSKFQWLPLSHSG